MARLASIDNIVGIKDEAGINPTQVTDFFLATEKVDPNFVIFNGDDVMLLSTIVTGRDGNCQRRRSHFSATKSARSSTPSQRVRMRRRRSCSFRFTGSASPAGQNGRLLPNSILRPAIELVTGIKLGPARSPLAPATDAEMEVVKGILKEIGKL